MAYAKIDCATQGQMAGPGARLGRAVAGSNPVSPIFESIAIHQRHVPINYLYATRNALKPGTDPRRRPQLHGFDSIEDQPPALQSLEVTNLSGTITVTWPTDEGLQTQSLVAGNRITLNGLIP